ncbi:MAG TPA: tripartite tricarboxylate transporter substrate binding protein [Burkholderiaceae bacterium]|nr:tripartite tricarboxylate transporter substrate binding protein [Burkholderiaceae bacterium]
MPHAIVKTMLFAAISAAFAVTEASANTYPTRPITLIVPTAPGGAGDSAARILANELGQRLGQPFVVENRPGASYTIGTSAITKLPADGYTVLFGVDTGFTAAPYLVKPAPYDPVRDFEPVSYVGSSPLVLLANATLPYKSLPELIAYAKEKPRSVTFASGGQGSAHHLAMELLQRSTGASLLHVPYKAAPLGLTGMLGGHVDLIFISYGPALPHLNTGKAKGLAVTTAKALESIADIRPIGETVQGYDFTSWFGLFVRAGTPPEVKRKLEDATTATLSSPEVRKKLAGIGVVAEDGTAASMELVLRRDTQTLAPLLADIGKANAK